MKQSDTRAITPIIVFSIGTSYAQPEVWVERLSELVDRPVHCERILTLDTLEAALQRTADAVVVCDLDDPQISAEAVVRRVQQMQPPTPVFVAAETPQVNDAVDMMRLGASGFVAKADTDRFAQLIQQTLNSSTHSILGERVGAAPPDDARALRDQITAILDTTQDALMSISLPDRQLIYVSASYEKIYGYPVERALADPDFYKHIVPSDDLELATAAMSTCLREGLVELDHRIILPDGRIRWLHRRAWVVYDEAGHPVQVNDSARDITARKLAEEALQRSETRLRSLFENMQDVVWTADLPSYQIIYLNPAARAVFGRPEADFYEDPELWHKIIHPDDAHRIEELTAMLLQGGLRDTTYRIVRPDGGVRWLHDRAWLVRDAEGQAVRMEGIATDITTRQLADETLIASEAKQTALVAAIPDSILYIQSDGTVLDYHGRRDIGLLPLEMVIGSNLYDLYKLAPIPDPVLQQTLAAVQTVIATRQLAVFEYTLPDRRDYEARMIPVGATNALMCIIRDITERKRAERQLQQSEQRLRLFIEHAPAAIAIFDTHMNYLAVSRRWSQDYHLDQEQLVGRNHHDIFPDLPEHWKQSYQRCLKGAVEKYEEEPFPRADGTLDWVRWEAHPWRDVDGTIGGILLFSEVITERVQAEEALRHSESYLRSLVDSQTAFNVRTDVLGKITYHNQRYRDQFGWMASNIDGLYSLDMILPVDHVKVFDAVSQCLTNVGVPYQVEIRKYAKDGGHIWTLWEFIAVQSADGSTSEINCVGFDISKQKQAELALQEANDLLEQRVVERTAELERAKDRIEAIFQHSGDGIVLLDVQEGIQQANYAFYAMFGIPDGSAQGTKLSACFHPDEASRIEAVLAEVAATHQTEQIESRALRALGNVFDVEINIAPVNRSERAVNNIVCIIRDITERKHSQEALRASEERYRRLISTMSEGLVLQTRDGAIQTFNAAAERILGLSGEQLMGRTSVDPRWHAVHEDGSPFPGELHPAMVALATGQPQSNIVMGIHKPDDANVTWILINSQPLFEPNHTLPYAAVATFTDITASKMAETAMRESEERYRLLAENVNDVLYKVSAHGDITFVTASAFGVLGYHPEELINQPADFIVHPDDLSALIGSVRKVAVSGAPHVTLHARLRHKSGVYVWVEIAATIVHDPQTRHSFELIGVLRDVTERKLAEDALRASEEKFRTFLEAAPIATVIADMQARIIVANQAAADLFGYQRSDLIGRTIDTLVAEPYRAEQASRVKQERALIEHHALAFESEGLRRDGSTFPCDTQLSFIETSEGPMVMSHVIDTTQRRRAEEALKQSLAQERELGELKSRFVSMASHEFRTPLAAILAATETLSLYRDRMDQAQIDGRLDRIRQQVTYMRDTMEDVLHLARMQAGRVKFEPRPGDVAALSREIVTEFDSQHDYQGRLQFTCATAPLLAEFDERLLRQIFSNLIHNALKYSRPEEPVVVEVVEDEDSFRLRVEDQGIGIPDEDLKHLFEPFHRARNVGTISGTGLGLSITRQSVELHGGTITVESREGVGTTFEISIPKLVKPPMGNT